MPTKTLSRYVVWRATDDGRWYPSQAMPREDAFDLAQRLEHDGEAFVLVPAPQFDPEED